MHSATADADPTTIDAHLADLQRAVRIGDLGTARAILDVEPQFAFADSPRGGSLLLEAHEREHTALAECFLSVRARAGGVRLDLHEACALSRIEDARLALAATPLALGEPGPAGFHALHRAAFSGDIDCVTLLLDAGADVDASSENGGRLTPLHSVVAGAARHGDTAPYHALARLLLSHGANPDLPMEGDWTALSAAEHDDLDGLVRALTPAAANEFAAGVGLAAGDATA